jgi:uncharacterized damage-inducible protein DinB
MPELRDIILDAWKTNNRVTILLVENLPPALWKAQVPGAPRRTVRTIAAHLHNSRCTWIRTLGKEFGLSVPVGVDRHRVSTRELVSALKRSGMDMLSLLEFGCKRDGRIPASKAYVWRNLPLDVGHVLTYFVAHEAHHRGQIVMLARELGHRLPSEVTNELWNWTRLSREK